MAEGSHSQIIVIVQSGESFEPAEDQETFARHADFWLSDGNLILLAGNTAFRVYQGLLTKKSAVFADMVITGSADATETFDGCPVVRLPDHPEDLADFLQYLMPCAELRLHEDQPVSQFVELHAAIHLAHKYQCPDGETRALSILKNYYTSHFAEYNQHKFTNPMLFPPLDAAIAAVNIARLTDTPSMLPFALYLACNLGGQILDGYKRRDGSVEHLSAADLRLVIDGRNTLQTETVALLKAVFTRCPSDGCRTNRECKMALKEIYEEMDSNTAGELICLNPYDRIIKTWAEDYELCGVCTGKMLERELAERKRVWMLLPGMFELTTEDCGFTADDEPPRL